MKLKSTVLGIIILLVLFGVIAASVSLGWWQTEGGGQRKRQHSGGSESASYLTSTLRDTISGYDLPSLTVDEHPQPKD